MYGEQAKVVCMRLWGDLSQQWTWSSIESIIIIVWVGGAVVAAIHFWFIEPALISRRENDLQLRDFCDWKG